jgi:SAM-dependent methyltransferase
MAFSFLRYLEAKKSIDDRALNRQVLNRLQRELINTGEVGPLKILEVGCGIGTMVERLIEGELIARFDYTGLDIEAGALLEAYRRLRTFAPGQGLACQEGGDGKLLLSRADHCWSLNFLPIDVFDFAADEDRHGSWDVLIAHAFLDLLPLAVALPILLSLVRPGGLCYFSLNFDGVTTWLPPLDDRLDDQIEALYHQSMHQSSSGGSSRSGSRSGRLLLTLLPPLGLDLLTVGSSDWAVLPHQGKYLQDEAYFLSYLLHLLEEALAGNATVDPAQLQYWLSTRRKQLETGELMLLTHQWDILGRMHKS